ncbi:hypothetical protein SAMN05216548_10429 [Faunimonas pinastri]|uniref:Uncharacterized protein n=1 Tax=Faunimonas pinastri TaxID=1855383 RepID=A0A1H9F801_9HYPH|nr:hypothetical protein [Faunimonas pinastri]SEQ33999.1 hypothetical protein SAMN05216548_10429 [Faunimonas pinastri]
MNTLISETETASDDRVIALDLIVAQIGNTVLVRAANGTVGYITAAVWLEPLSTDEIVDALSADEADTYRNLMDALREQAPNPDPAKRLIALTDFVADRHALTGNVTRDELLDAGFDAIEIEQLMPKVRKRLADRQVREAA